MSEGSGSLSPAAAGAGCRVSRPDRRGGPGGVRCGNRAVGQEVGVAKKNVGPEARLAAATLLEDDRLSTLWAEHGGEEETVAGRFWAWAAADELSGGEPVEALWAGANPWGLHVRLPESPVEARSKGQPRSWIVFVLFQGRLFDSSGPSEERQWLRTEARV